MIVSFSCSMVRMAVVFSMRAPFDKKDACLPGRRAGVRLKSAINYTWGWGTGTSMGIGHL
jgi:hypothetical protein